MLKALLQEISEDYLGVALIRSGDTVIINERSVLAFWLLCRQAGWNRVDTSHALQECSVWDFFMHTGTQRKNVIKPINRFADGCPARVGKREEETVEFAK